jgi:hypothetical protein
MLERFFYSGCSTDTRTQQSNDGLTLLGRQKEEDEASVGHLWRISISLLYDIDGCNFGLSLMRKSAFSDSITYEKSLEKLLQVQTDKGSLSFELYGFDSPIWWWCGRVGTQAE